MKKRILAALILALSLSFALSACGSDSKSSKKDSKKKTESKKDDDDDDDFDTDNKKSKVEDDDDDFDVAPAAEDDDEEDLKATASNKLQELIDSAEMQAELKQVNSTLQSSGISCELESDGENTLVLIYTFTDTKDLGNLSKSQIQEQFDEKVGPVFEEQGKVIANAFKQGGANVKTLVILLYNGDGTLLYEKEMAV